MDTRLKVQDYTETTERERSQSSESDVQCQYTFNLSLPQYTRGTLSPELREPSHNVILST